MLYSYQRCLRVYCAIGDQGALFKAAKKAIKELAVLMVKIGEMLRQIDLYAGRGRQVPPGADVDAGSRVFNSRVTLDIRSQD